MTSYYLNFPRLIVIIHSVEPSMEPYYGMIKDVEEFKAKLRRLRTRGNLIELKNRKILHITQRYESPTYSHTHTHTTQHRRHVKCVHETNFPHQNHK